MSKPLAIDLFCGLGGWTEGLLENGYYVAGFDIERHVYGEHRYPAQLVVQDILTLHGSQFKDAALIVASPPCQEYSYMAMPWSRAKQIQRALRGEGDFPAGYRGSRTVDELNRLFEACFRIQREACEAAGRHIPMVVENVKGAQAWVGKARWNFGSFYLWGDVPALMPMAFNHPSMKHPGTGSWSNYNKTGAISPSWSTNGGNSGLKQPLNCSPRMCKERDIGRLNDGIKVPSEGTGRRTAPGNGARFTSRDEGVKRPGISGKRNNGKGDKWFQDGAARSGSKSNARKYASAMIAKIPLTLSCHIATVFKPSAAA